MPKEAGQRVTEGPRIKRLTVRPTSDDRWSLLVDDLEEPAWVVTTRARAVEAAREAARDHRAQLVIEKRVVGGAK